ncbi:3-hydroxybutyrate dehydrogenase [Marinobacterium marinum]|uniref:3-hydroxybutyrate dehydrogenase n=1 Tax=Marinobacterium marinum TaxID=2756129 RepID=A0A7W2ABP8_9GAMM|nr:3-hydroxybutyrate dehydrogenase [Marinobacterium marinum]MBA4501674.1 3-hydroxybutyrate dehydrogenase [Marinobacterium marinum]
MTITTTVSRTVLVTGALGGIGQAICIAMARQGHSIILHDRLDSNDSTVLSFHAKLEELGAARVTYRRADLSLVDEIDAMFDDLVDHGFSIDILVNNAAIQHTAPIEAFPLDTWSNILAINLTAVYRCMQRSIPLMRQSGWGRIVSIASVHGLVGSIHKAAYVAAKHGLVGLTKVTALETAEQNITVNAICPGWTDTPLLGPQIEARQRQLESTREAAIYDLVREKQPSGRLIDPVQVAGLVEYLVSDMAQSMTGTALPIDGGWTCQ